ncbi:MAG: carbamoyl-phosphate synthase large subunit [Acidobacteriota bacterium]|jgi:carbamoyl-phosphate synthase large subunit|nr:carbamoyl-phosphate synthase large subunit [Acidobacteriota bacterium]
MPKRDDIRKVLIPGAGPVVIGRAGELDWAALESCKALRELGYETVFVNSNPASVTAESSFADAVYIEPLDADSLGKVIAAERPDTLLPFPGGQPGLRLALGLDEGGVLAGHGVKLLGATPGLLRQCGDRDALLRAAAALGLETPRGVSASDLAGAEAALSQIDLPCLVRPAWSPSGEGVELAYNLDEFRRAVGRGLSIGGAGRACGVRVEDSPEGLRKLAVVLLRDGAGGKAVLGVVEDIDGAEVHSGDAIRVTPPQTVPGEILSASREQAFALADALGVVGCACVRFAWAPEAGRLAVDGFTPVASRTAALVARATGAQVFRAAAQLAAGLTLGEAAAAPEAADAPAVAVKVPRWDFAGLRGAQDRLGAQMRSTGEALGLGGTFAEALQKAVRALEITMDGAGVAGLGAIRRLREKPLGELKTLLWRGTSDRPFVLYEALRQGADAGELAARTRLSPWFVGQVKGLVECEGRIAACKGGELPAGMLAEAKRQGFADARLAELLAMPESEVRARRKEAGVTASFLPVASQGVWYSTYGAKPATRHAGAAGGAAPALPREGGGRRVLIVGPGPNRIGQGGEFGYCCAEAALELESLGYAPVLLDSNPGAVTVGGKVYCEPVTAENVMDVYEDVYGGVREGGAQDAPEGALLQFGGATPRSLVHQLAGGGVKILGVTPGLLGKLALAEDADGFRAALERAGIPHPATATACGREEALSAAARIGYPLMLRPSARAAAVAPEIAHDAEDLGAYMDKAAGAPVRMDKFIENAIKAEAVALADGEDIHIPAVIEYIERAGIHSGDSACVLPPVHLAAGHLRDIGEYTRKIVAEFGSRGLVDVRYALSGDTVYVLNATLRSHRWAAHNAPLVAKVCGLPVARLAVRLMLGAKLGDLRLDAGEGGQARAIPRYGVKESVFPFNMFPEVDPVLGPEMHSTGAALGLAGSYELAFHKAEEAAGQLLPQSGTVLFSISAPEKSGAVELAREFAGLGFKLKATEGTQKFFADAGVACEKVLKLNFGRPDIVDAIKNGEVQLVVNTPIGKRGAMDDSYIRKTAIRERVPYITTLAAARAAAKGIEARRALAAGGAAALPWRRRRAGGGS